MDERRIACDRCGAEVGAEERHAEIEYVYGDGGGSMTLCRDCFKLVMDTVHGRKAKRQGDAEPPTMDERRAVARRMREYDDPVLASQQTTREAVDAVVECMGLEADEKMCTVRYFLDRLADLIDPGADTTMSAYDMLPEGDRAVLDFFDAMHDGLYTIDATERHTGDEMVREVFGRLMPRGMEWPRFDDLEPVRIGDDFMDMHGRVHTVASVRLKEDGGFSLVGTDRWGQSFAAGSRVERPGDAPKVLDADGVEIREGDTVYHVEDGSEMTVYEIDGEWLVVSVGGRVRHDIVTHRAPVLAADGKPLREGEEVWHVSGGEPEIVAYTITADSSHPDQAVLKGHEDDWPMDAKCLTHERPDSWERLEEAGMAAKASVEERRAVASRLRALTGGRINWTGLQCAVFGGTALRSDTVARLAELIDPGEGMDESGRSALYWMSEGENTCELDIELVSESDNAAIAWVREHGGLDAVEARLIPEGMEWPRFEDGDPVSFGDQFENADGGESVLHTLIAKDCRESLGDGVFWKLGKGAKAVWLKDGERVKRPAPKVLGADGVEIRVGDTVWSAAGEFDGERTVKAVFPDDGEEPPYATFMEQREPWSCLCCCLTHRAPVLAADGRPLREGGHVYHIETGTELVVKRLPKPGEYQAVVVFALPTSPASHLTSFDPDQLTHKRPEIDSWERLEDDATIDPRAYCSEHRLYIDPYDGDSAPATENFARDLVRRTKALAGVSE